MKNPDRAITRRTALALCGQAALPAAEPQELRPPREHDLDFRTPVTTWDEALPLGNGLMGALIWGDGSPLRISLDRSDLWDLRAVPEFHAPDYNFATLRKWKEEGRINDIRRVYEAPYRRPAPTKIPAGRIEIDFGSDARFAASRLRLATAEATADVGSHHAAVYVHAAEPVGMLRISGAASVQFRLLAPPFSGAVAEAARGGIEAGELAQLGYLAPLEESGEGWQSYVQEGAGGFRFAVYLGWRAAGKGWEAAWSIATNREASGLSALARRRVKQALERGYDSMMASHRQWWTDFWGRSAIRVPNKVIERQWYLDTYKFGAAARKNTPPISLQAVWTADNRKLPPWKGDYHHDLNTQLSYWPCYSGNHLGEGLGYLDWLWETRDTAVAWTKRFFDLPGLNVPMTADLNGNQIGGWVQYTHSATTSAWLAHHFYLHWKYSRDRWFLEHRAYRYLRSAAEFIDAFTAVKDASGKRTHPLSASPEINDNRMDAWFAGITNYDLALEHWLLGAAAELADEMKLPGEASRWRRVANELPGFSRGADGKLLVAPGVPLAVSHRHLSHLMAIHPLGLIDVKQSAGARRTVNASLADLDRLGTSE
ncbi:MAG: glycoside hydrolase N-terminal domain-containing protein, partial [Bryobacterales bacterium]|nr:glycoside hydrolase N-terminal domain-containing protein [Bryobacterales bacterium]